MFYRWMIHLSLLAALPVQATLEKPVELAVAQETFWKSSDTNLTLTISGQIVSLNGDSVILSDNSMALSVIVPRQFLANLTVGDVVRLRAHQLSSGHMPICQMPITVLGHYPAPTALELDGARINNRRFRNAFVRITGVITSVMRDELDDKWNWIQVKTETATVAVSAREAAHPLSSLQSLIDASVSLEGTILPFACWRSRLGEHLNLSGQMKILRQPPIDFDSVPAFAGQPAEHRRRLKGNVIASGRGRFFLQRPNGEIMQIRPQADTTLPKSGSSVTVIGFPELDPLRWQLVEALVKTNGSQCAAGENIVPVTIEQLFTNNRGKETIATWHSLKVVRLTGRIMAMAGDAGSCESLTVENLKKSVIVDTSTIEEFPQNAKVGSKVSIVGLCLAEFMNPTSSIDFPRFRQFTVFPRTAADVVVTENPPWWTARRLMTLIAILSVAIVIILIWNRSLQLLSERRGRQLYREELGHVLAEEKAEERTRLAVELHDSISQTLTGIAMQVDAACQADRRHAGTAGNYLDTARALLASCRQELRCCIWDLRSRTFEEKSLQEAIIRTLRPHVGTADLDVKFDIPCRLLSESTVHVILRIVRELSVNAILHGKATKIQVVGSRQSSRLQFSVSDNGGGFDPQKLHGTPATGHFGLQGIRERIKTYHGSFQIESVPATGTRATVTLFAPELEDPT